MFYLIVDLLVKSVEENGNVSLHPLLVNIFFFENVEMKEKKRTRMNVKRNRFECVYTFREERTRRSSSPSTFFSLFICSLFSLYLLRLLSFSSIHNFSSTSNASIEMNASFAGQFRSEDRSGQMDTLIVFLSRTKHFS